MRVLAEEHAQILPLGGAGARFVCEATAAELYCNRTYTSQPTASRERVLGGGGSCVGTSRRVTPLADRCPATSACRWAARQRSGGLRKIAPNSVLPHMGIVPNRFRHSSPMQSSAFELRRQFCGILAQTPQVWNATFKCAFPVRISRRNTMPGKLAAAALILSLLASTSAYAADGDQPALAPGKPAGVREAGAHTPVWVWIAGVGFVALGIGLIVSGSGGHSGGSTTATHL